MPRDVAGNELGPTPKDVVHLIRIKYWDGALEQEVRLTDAISDLSIDVGSGAETWTGTGLLLSIGAVDESADLDAPGIDIAFDGVNQSIISVIANNQFRGRAITIWRVWLDPATGLIKSPGTGPVQIFDGYQNEPYSISESFTEQPDVVAVSTRAVGAISRITKLRSVKTNLTSHREMLEAAGLSFSDTFFQHVPGLEGKEIYWGRDEPGITKADTKGTTGGGAGTKKESG